MAKEEVLEAVVEEPVDVDGTEEELSPWYVFCSTGCGFCKKSEPIVEELNNEGYDILVLDMAEPDNQKLNQELQAEYKTQCGTPWFINADTGKGICGYREKDVLLKWLAGEDIPIPPRPTGAPPKVPFQGSTNKEELAWKKEYKKWLKDNKHMGDDWVGRQKSANDLIDGPRPKSDPPRPPMGPQMAQATDADFDKWGGEMKVWQEENKHLPNLQPVDNVVQQLKVRRDQMANQGVPVPPAPPVVNNNAQLNTLDAKVQSLEVKLDRILSHFGVK